ncbi:MAG TPA: hypothetical protein VJ808_11290 [Gemmatimonadales bacterium]|nr:hypothetical protein [Gemmatimonadales bacterium]
MEQPTSASVEPRLEAEEGGPPTRPSLREARLKPAFADEYVGIEPGVWLSAARLAEQLITRLLREGVADEELPQRVLNPAHFEFRGGEGAATRSALTR